MPAARSRKLACAQAAGLRKNTLPVPQTRIVKIVPGLRVRQGLV